MLHFGANFQCGTYPVLSSICMTFVLAPTSNTVLIPFLRRRHDRTIVFIRTVIGQAGMHASQARQWPQSSSNNSVTAQLKFDSSTRPWIHYIASRSGLLLLLLLLLLLTVNSEL
jgi:hypothetical protein